MNRMGKLVATLACGGVFAFLTPAQAATIDLFAIVDGEIHLTNGVPVLGSTTQAFNTTQNVIAGQEWRSVFEFDLPVLTDPIVSATFMGAVTGNTFPPTLLSVYGYSGNGVVDAADATLISTLFGSTTLSSQVPSGQSINLAVSLSPSLVEGLGSGFLGLTTTVGEPHTVLIASLENTVFAHPMLRLETLSDGGPGPGPGPEPGPGPVPVPEPGTMILLGSGLVGLVAKSRRRMTPNS